MKEDEEFLELLNSLEQLVPLTEENLPTEPSQDDLEDLFVDPQQESIEAQYQIPIELIESGWLERDDLETALDLEIFQRGIKSPKSFSSVLDLQGLSLQFPNFQGQ